MLCIKTGMLAEESIAQRYAGPGIMILTGLQTIETLNKVVPPEVKAILSFGVCGGLVPSAQIGQAFICDILVTPTKTYQADVAWRKRLFAATRYYECHWYSSGDFNTANTIAQRAELFATTGCTVIDDETDAVAEFAEQRGIPFQALRTISDGAQDDLPPAVVNALNINGTDNIWNVIASVASDPAQIPNMIKTAIEAKKSFDELETAAIQIGPQFCWEQS